MSKVAKVPGIFRVNGVNHAVAKKAAEKKMQFYKVDGKPPTREQYDAQFEIEWKASFKTMKGVPISQPFSTPELAQQYINLTKQTQAPDSFRGLVLMIHYDTGKFNQKTGKPMRKWIPLSEYRDLTKQKVA